jgi:uncharacterized membrane protein
MIMKNLTTIHLSQARTILNRLALGLTISTLIGACAWAQESSDPAIDATTTTPIYYNFDNVVFQGDTFVQLLGVNKHGKIAGYHGSGVTGHPNKGFVLTLPNSFSTENFPNSAQTQVIGINDSNETTGFFVDQKGLTHGFIRDSVRFKQVDYPGTTFTQLLGINNFDETAGYYADAAGIDHAFVFNRFGNLFEVFTTPLAPGGAQATGINDAGWVSGFYIDAKNVNHGFLLAQGKLTTLDFPNSTFTQALGIDQQGNVVGFYMDQGQLSHGFHYNYATKKFQSIDDPQGVGTTVVNGINQNGTIVGFYVDGKGNTDGFVGTPE